MSLFHLCMFFVCRLVGQQRFSFGFVEPQIGLLFEITDVVLTLGVTSHHKFFLGS